MPTEFTREATLPISARKFFYILIQQQYWFERVNDMSETSEIISFDKLDNGIEVHVVNAISAESLPETIRKARPQGIIIDRTEKWTRDDNTIVGNFSAQVKDTDVRVTGQSTVTEHGPNECLLSTNAVAIADIPLFGRKIEAGIIDNINTLLDHELEYTKEWISQLSQ